MHSLTFDLSRIIILLKTGFIVNKLTTSQKLEKLTIIRNSVVITQKKKSNRNFNSISLSLSVFGSSIYDVKINCFPFAKYDV